MKIRDSRSSSFRQRPPARHAITAAAALLPITLLATLGVVSARSQQYSQLDQKPMRDPSGIPPPSPAANPQPNANQRMLYRMQREENLKRIEQLNTLRQKELTSDTARLLALAKQVRQETIDGSAAVPALELNKVEAIEKLARSVREKMEYTFSQ